MKFIYLGAVILLGGCAALPPAVTYLGYAKTAVDVGVYVATDKTTTDHALSAMIEKDCALFRILKDKKICVEYKKDKEIEIVQKKDEHQEQSEVDFIIPDEITYEPHQKIYEPHPSISIDYSVLDVLEMEDRIKNNRL